MDELRTGRPLKVAAYTRVSTPDQNPELQLQELSDYAGRQSWDVIERLRAGMEAGPIRPLTGGLS